MNLSRCFGCGCVNMETALPRGSGKSGLPVACAPSIRRAANKKDHVRKKPLRGG